MSFNPPCDFTNHVKVFNGFFDNHVIQKIVTYSEFYARSKGNNTFSTMPDETRAFLGVLLVSDYSPEPHRYLHWTLADDVHNEAIASAFTRNLFEEIIKYNHLSGNARLGVSDYMVKVHPLLSMKNMRDS